MSYEKQAYIAGIVDGEGCMGIWASKPAHGIPFVITITVHNTNKEIIDLLYKEYGGCFHQNKLRDVKWKQVWKWYLTTKKALLFIAEIYPWLVIKRREAEVMLDVLYNYPTGAGRRGHPFPQSCKDKLHKASLELKALKKAA